MATQQDCHLPNPVLTKRIDRQANVSEEPLWEVVFSCPPEEPLASGSQRDGAAKTSTRKREHARKIPGVVIGKLSGTDETGQPLVDFPGSPRKQGLPARTTLPWTEADMGREVVLIFERGHPRQPIIMGFLRSPQSEPVSQVLPVQANMDGKRLVLTAKEEITLRCGKASLTLTQAGKVLLRGTFLVSHSSGVNRIKGGSVQIN